MLWRDWESEVKGSAKHSTNHSSFLINPRIIKTSDSWPESIWMWIVSERILQKDNKQTDRHLRALIGTDMMSECFYFFKRNSKETNILLKHLVFISLEGLMGTWFSYWSEQQTVCLGNWLQKLNWREQLIWMEWFIWAAMEWITRSGRPTLFNERNFKNLHSVQMIRFTYSAEISIDGGLEGQIYFQFSNVYKWFYSAPDRFPIIQWITRETIRMNTSA